MRLGVGVVCPCKCSLFWVLVWSARAGALYSGCWCGLPVQVLFIPDFNPTNSIQPPHPPQDRKVSLEAEAALCEKKLERATKLIGGLGVSGMRIGLHGGGGLRGVHHRRARLQVCVLWMQSQRAPSRPPVNGYASSLDNAGRCCRPSVQHTHASHTPNTHLPRPQPIHPPIHPSNQQGEKTRWSEVTARLARDYVNLTGDVLLAAGCVRTDVRMVSGIAWVGRRVVCLQSRF